MPPRDIPGEFRKEALQILAKRTPPEEVLTFHKSPAIEGGRVEVHKLANGCRIDVIGIDKDGKPSRRSTQHQEDIGRARLIGAWTAIVLCIDFRDCTKGAQP